MGEFKVLFVGADAGGGPRSLSIQEEVRRIEKQVRLSPSRDALAFTYALAARPMDLINALNHESPNAVHFSGHGEADGAFQFIDDQTGAPRPVSPAALAEVFRAVRGNVRLVVVNACDSKLLAQAVAGVVECAVGMRQPIEDGAAIRFSEGFYGAIGACCSVQEAFEQGKAVLGMYDRADREIPELFPRDGVDPARLFLVRGGPHTPCDAAVAVVRDELQANLTNLAARIAYTLDDIPGGDPVPRRPGEPWSAFDDRDQRWFMQEVSAHAVGYARFPLRTGGYDAHRLNLAECEPLRREAAERAYAALMDAEERVALYRGGLAPVAGASPRTTCSRAAWAELYSRQTAVQLAIHWYQVLQGWALLEPDPAVAALMAEMLPPRVLQGVDVAGRFGPGAEGWSYALRACAALESAKAALIAEEMELRREPEG